MQRAEVCQVREALRIITSNASTRQFLEALLVDVYDAK
jgi:hypothetical protein